MTSLGDLCACGDLARPGHDLCAGCIADRQAERTLTEKAAALLTAENEARIIAADEVTNNGGQT